MTPYATLLDRVAALAAEMPEPDGHDVRRVCEIGRSLAARGRENGKIVASSADPELARELLRLMETLGRRGAHALPAATLARAAFADLKGDELQSRILSGEVEEKLTLLGV